MGVSALESHATGKKHKSLIKERKQYSETFFPQKKSSERNSEKEEGQSTSIIQKETGKQKQSAKSIDQYAVSINNLNAEILWCMYVVKGHLSYNLCSNIKELFNVMFPDSDIVAQFSLGTTKCRHVILFGLAPYFKNALIKDINNSLYYSLSFDEGLNSIVQKCQMDINIRYWDNKEKKVKTRYLDSQFLERPNADKLFQSLKTAIGKKRVFYNLQWTDLTLTGKYLMIH